MANRGSFGWDMTFKVGSRVATSTSQWYWVCGDQTAPTSYTPNIPSTITANWYPVGIVQSGNMSANSQQVTVRVGGVSLVQSADTFGAFAWLKINTTGSVMQATASAVQTGTITTAAIIGIGIVGQSLESGVTNSVVEMMIRPYLSNYGFQ